MKKTFAILLSVVLSVVVLFAFALGTAADSVLTVSSVTIIDADDNTVVLDETNTTYSAKTGKITFDASTGTLTLDNVSGVKNIRGRDGSLTLVVKGTNTLEHEGMNLISLDTDVDDTGAPVDPSHITNITVKGDGVLNVKGHNYLLMSRSGSIKVTDRVTLNLEANNPTGFTDVIHVASGGKDIVFSGKAAVNASVNGTTCFRNAGNGSIILRNDAQVSATLTGTEVVSRTVFSSRKFKMFDGSLSVTMDAEGLPHNITSGSTYTCTAISVSGTADVSATAEFLGGNVDIDLVGTVNQKAAFSAVSVKTADSVTFKNTKLDVVIDYPGNSDNVTGVVNLVDVSALTVTNSKMNFSANKNVALFSVSQVGDTKENAVFKMDFNNTILTGECYRMVYCPSFNEAKPPFVSAINLDFDKSNVANLALAGGVLHSYAKAITTVTTNAKYLTGADFTSGVALITGDPESKVMTITVTPPKGANITLNAGKRTLNETDAKYLGVPADSIVYDPVTATVTLNNMNGSVNRLWASGSVTYVLKGENVITMKPDLGKYYAFGSSEDTTIAGDGTLTISGGMCTIVSKNRLVIEDDAKVKVISNKNADGDYAIHLTGDEDNSLIVRGNALLDVLAGESGIFLAGAQPYLQITENAKVTVAPIEDSFAGQAIYLCPDIDNKTGSQDAVLEVSGNASLKIDKGAGVGVEFAFVASEKVKDEEGNITETPAIQNTTAVNAVFEILDNAVVDIAASNQGVFFNVKGNTDSALFLIQDKAAAKFASIDPTSETTRGAAVEMYSTNNVVTMNTTGKVEMSSNAGGDRGTFFIRGTDYDVLVKDTVLNVTNVSTSKVSPGGDIACAINFDGKGDGKFVVAGKAVLTAKAEKNGTDKDNRAYGIFLNSDHTMTIQDNAWVNASSGGDSKVSLGAAIHLKKASVVVCDNGKLVARATGTSVAGIMFEGDSLLTVKENGKASISGEGEGVAGVRSYNRTAKGSIDVTDGSGAVEISGDPAFNVKLKKITVTASLIKAGENKKNAQEAKDVSGSEAYVFLSANAKVVQMPSMGSPMSLGEVQEFQGMGNNESMDLIPGQSSTPSVLAFVIPALALVAAAATVAVILWKKKLSR